MKPSPRIAVGAKAALRRRSARDITMDSLGQKIVSGVYAPGSLLPSSEELLAQLGVSRTTLREALQTLAAKGMIEARAKVGTRVLGQNRWNMFDADILAWREESGIPEASLAMLYEMRQNLEPAAAALAAEKRSDADVRTLRGWAAKLSLARGDVPEFVAADVAFHLLILEMSGNPFMRSIGALISTALTSSFTLSAPTEGARESAHVQKLHLDIVDAIERRDPQRASDAMTKVILKGWIRYSGSKLRKIADVQVSTFPEPQLQVSEPASTETPPNAQPRFEAPGLGSPRINGAPDSVLSLQGPTAISKA